MIHQDTPDEPAKPRAKTYKTNKFPLTLHPTGQYCKKIQGRTYYFGKDKKQALELYYQQAAELHNQTRNRPSERTLTVADLCNLYLAHFHSRVEAEEVKRRQYYDRRIQLKRFATAVDPNRLISDLTTMDLQEYRRGLIEKGHKANTINNYLAGMKAMFNWAEDNEMLRTAPKVRAVKKVPARKVERQTFTPDEIRTLLELANPKMRAMIWLALNCGFGCTDCAELEWRHLDLDAGRIEYPRGKTGVERNFVLWPQTIEALRSLPGKGELVFYTKRGNPYIKDDVNWGKARDDAITKEFAKLLRKAKIPKMKGTGFYTLRRTVATATAAGGDVYAVKGILGHSTIEQSTTYVQNTSPQIDRAIMENLQRLQLKPPKVDPIKDPDGPR